MVGGTAITRFCLFVNVLCMQDSWQYVDRIYRNINADEFNTFVIIKEVFNKLSS